MNEKVTGLFNALKSGDIAAVKDAFEKGDIAEFMDEEGRGPLMVLMEQISDYPEILNFIISKTADINAADRNGDTALFYAVKNKIIKTEEGEDTFIRPLRDPLYESVRILINAGIDVRIKNNRGETALYCARTGGHWKCVGLIASGLGIEITEEASEGGMLCDAALRMKNTRTLTGDMYEKRKDVFSRCGGESEPGDYDVSAIMFLGEFLSALDQGSNWDFRCERFYSDSMGGRAVTWKIETASISVDHKVLMGLNESWQSVEVETFIFDLKGLPPLLGLSWDGESCSAFSPMEVRFSGVDEDLIRKAADIARRLYRSVDISCSRFRSAPRGFPGYEGVSLQTLCGFRDTGAELIDALNDGSKRRVSALLKKGTGPELFDSNGDPYIMIPVLSERIDLVDLFLSNGAYIDARGCYGYTPLIKAICYGKSKSAQYLIEKGADVNAMDNEGYTPLMLALNEKNDDIAALLLDRGADLNAVDSNGGTILICACRAGNIKLVRNCIECGIDVNRWSSLGYSPLNEAIYEGFTDIARLLIETGAEVDHPYTNRSKPLHLAASKNNSEIITILINKGADLEGYADNGMRALHFAAYNGSTETVRALLEAGADRLSKDREGKTPLDYAVEKGHKKIATLLKD